MATATTTSRHVVRGYALALAGCAATTAIALPLAVVLDDANIAMLFLLAVAVVAAALGRGPAVAAAVVSVALFDFFFVEPRLSFAVRDAQYVVTFAVMLVVALLIGELAARLRRQAREAASREVQTLALYRLARDLSGALAAETVADVASRFVRSQLDAQATLLVPDESGVLSPVGAGAQAPLVDVAVATAAFDRGEAMPFVDRVRHGAASLALPLRTPLRVRGVLVVACESRDTAVSLSKRPLLDAVASLVAIVLERMHFVDVARDATVAVESERLRSSLLGALSHDLRTPLTSLVGLADSLARAQPPLPEPHARTASVIRDQALAMSRLAHDLLDMARLAAGRVELRKEWQPLEEVVGSVVTSIEPSLAGRRIAVDIPPDLPLLEFDAVMIERVLANLVDNAIRHAPGAAIAIAAKPRDGCVEIEVADDGPGIPPGRERSLFELFERGHSEGAAPGAGLGLSICRAIVLAHGGAMRAANRPAGGASFAFTLPAGTPPSIDDAAMERIADGQVGR